MKRLGLVVLAILFAAACGEPAPTPGQSETPPAGQTVEVNFWHAFAADPNQYATNTLVQKFNDSHTCKIHVTPLFARNYNETLAEIKTSTTARTTPPLSSHY